ncbi:MAG TPA: OmpH family outer membrane protein [Longimicrobiales bacterium]|jgi:outer membrane protein|nr:OmpH family outer membrane protein [Longimicrobiales bacterium]
MMRTLRAVPLALVAAALASPLLAQGPQKFAYIDTRRVIAEAPGAREAQATFDQEIQAFQAELQTLEGELQTLFDDYERQQVTLSPEARRERQEAIRTKQAEYQQRAQQMEQSAARRQAELVEPIMARIQSVLSEIQQSEGYAFIFDAAAGAVVAADPALDLTDQVLTRLRAGSAGQP